MMLYGMAYLASPYSHKLEHVREQRYKETIKFLGLAIKDPILRELFVYSPIAVWHNVAQLYDLPKGADWWHAQNIREMNKADYLFVLDLDGWRESVGVSLELEFARRAQFPIYLVTPKYESSEVILCPIS